MKTPALRIGIVGLGTVGLGTAKILLNERERLQKLTGVDCELRMVADIREGIEKSLPLPASAFVRDYNALVSHPDIDLVAELMGGTTIAADVILKALKNGKHVVTANKALLSEKGSEIFTAAKAASRVVGFEAAVCGGIPVIRALKEGLIGNRILSVYGILNGTANFILSKMLAERKDFKTALKEAQEKGFAEADPTLDIEGIDAAHKLSILASLAFGKFYSTRDIHVQGITAVSDLDIRYADEMDYCIKLLAYAGLSSDGRPTLSVAPTLLPKGSLLAGVNREYNGVVIQGDSVGHVLFTGKGAGSLPTGSAVVSDILHIACYGDLEAKRYAMYPGGLRGEVRPVDEFETEYYIRLKAHDQPGVMAQVSGELGRKGISIATLVQKQNTEDGDAIIVITTHKAVTRNVREAVDALNALPVVNGRAAPIRIINHFL